MKNRFATALLGVIAVLATACALVVLNPMASEAHTPNVGASCDTLTVFAEGTNYEGSDTNTVSVTLDGVTDQQTFATNGFVSLPIPADGLPHTWSASVVTTNPDPSFSTSDSGTITCGEPPASETPTPTPTPTPSATPTPTEPPTSEPPTEEPAVRSHLDCIGNTVVVVEEMFLDGEWETTSTSYTTKQCHPVGQPPVVEEGM